MSHLQPELPAADRDYMLGLTYYLWPSWFIGILAAFSCSKMVELGYGLWSLVPLAIGSFVMAFLFVWIRSNIEELYTGRAK